MSEMFRGSRLIGTERAEQLQRFLGSEVGGEVGSYLSAIEVWQREMVERMAEFVPDEKIKPTWFGDGFNKVQCWLYTVVRQDKTLMSWMIGYRTDKPGGVVVMETEHGQWFDRLRGSIFSSGSEVSDTDNWVRVPYIGGKFSWEKLAMHSLHDALTSRAKGLTTFDEVCSLRSVLIRPLMADTAAEYLLATMKHQKRMNESDDIWQDEAFLVPLQRYMRDVVEIERLLGLEGRFSQLRKRVCADVERRNEVLKNNPALQNFGLL